MARPSNWKFLAKYVHIIIRNYEILSFKVNKGEVGQSNCRYGILGIYVARYDGLLSYHLLNWQITEQLWCSWVYNMVYQWKKFFTARPGKFHGCRTTFHACPDIYGAHPSVTSNLLSFLYSLSYCPIVSHSTYRVMRWDDLDRWTTFGPLHFWEDLRLNCNKVRGWAL